MNKKFLGMKLSTILHFIICIVFAIVAWFLILYASYELKEVEECEQETTYLINMLRC